MKSNRALKTARAWWRAAVIAMLSVCFLSGYASAQVPSDFEQFMLELINRARANPEDEVMRTFGSSEWNGMPSLNNGLPPDTISSDPKQPLAFNVFLFDAADGYSELLLANSAFEHQFAGMPMSRMEDAGYSFMDPWIWAENLAVTLSANPLSIDADQIDTLHTAMFADEDSPNRSRRLNLMNSSFREVGIGIGIRDDGGYMLQGQSFNAILTTQDFALSEGSNLGDPFLTGVIYNDLVDDDFYTPGAGEGRSLTVEAYDAGTNNLVASVVAFASGGYSLGELASGFYDVRFVGGGSDHAFCGIDFTGSLNVKLDAVDLPIVVLIGDANGDNIVDAADYTIFANEFGSMGSALSADFNDDDMVDAADYTLWANHFGESINPPLIGDANGDNMVDAADYTNFANEFGSIGLCLSADFNNDNIVDAADYTLWANHFGEPNNPPPMVLIGDANGDNTVDAADYTLWANEFGQTAAGLSADFNNDDTVDAADYTLWANHFGESLPGSPSSTSVQSVPEPSAAGLAILGGLLAIVSLLPRRRETTRKGAAQGISTL